MSVSRVVKFIETESRRVAARGWGEKESHSLMGIGFQFCKMKRLLEIGSTTT